MPDDDKPLEILPWGRTLADSEKIDRKKAAARRGGFGCLLMALAFALFATFAAGWMNGRAAQLNVNESAVAVTNRNATEQRK